MATTRWRLVGGLWAVAVLAWPLLAAVQALTGDAAGTEGGLTVARPWTLMDTGFMIFIVGVPVAAVATVAAGLFTGTPGEATAFARVLRWLGRLALLAGTALVAVFAAQLVAFFLVTPALTALFRLG